MNRYHLVHVTEFQYDGPVSESYNEVRLRPLHDEAQSCLSFRLSTTPQAKASAHRDFFGNWVHQFNILPEHRWLRVEAESMVMVHPAGNHESQKRMLADLAVHGEDLSENYSDFLAPTNYAPHLRAVSDLVRAAEKECDGTMAGFCQSACLLIHDRFRYEKGATHVHSSIRDALKTEAGVCQDFAHLLLAVVRVRGLPGRYVSGYVAHKPEQDSMTNLEEVAGGAASHAWMEVFVPGEGWTGLDPTQGNLVTPRHIRVAYGRDYGDVPPVRGVYKGHSGQRLSVDVLVRPALDDEGREYLQETAAAPPPPSFPQEQPQ